MLNLKPQYKSPTAGTIMSSMYGRGLFHAVVSWGHVAIRDNEGGSGSM